MEDFIPALTKLLAVPQALIEMFSAKSRCSRGFSNASEGVRVNRAQQGEVEEEKEVKEEVEEEEEERKSLVSSTHLSSTDDSARIGKAIKSGA